jgi:hypothetical protein
MASVRAELVHVQLLREAEDALQNGEFEAVFIDLSLA